MASHFTFLDINGHKDFIPSTNTPGHKDFIPSTNTPENEHQITTYETGGVIFIIFYHLIELIIVDSFRLLFNPFFVRYARQQ
jgi:hypothetical protein